MIQPPDTGEQITGERPLYPCWYATVSTMPMQVNIEKSGVDFAWCRRLAISIGYEDLYDTEREAIDAARKARSQRIDTLNKEIDKLDQRVAKIE